MGVFPEPAPCADDVSRLVPDETVFDTRPGCRPTRPWHRIVRRRLSIVLAAGILLGTALPRDALSPSASAHDRIDLRPRIAAQVLDRPAEADREPWAGVPLLEQQPPTLALIETDLAALPQPLASLSGDMLRFGDVEVPRALVDAILRASGETGVDPVYMMALADKESRFSPTVKASTSSAEGLFQFLSGTWFELVRRYGPRHGLDAEAAAISGRGRAITVTDEAMRNHVLRLRHDPYVAALMAGELIKRDRARIAQRIGRDLDTSELYLAHFLGTASAGKFLALTQDNPTEVARTVFRSAARANRSLFTQKVGKARRGLTVAELRNRIDDMIDRRLNQYEGVAALAPGTGAVPESVTRRRGVVQVTEALP